MDERRSFFVVKNEALLDQRHGPGQRQTSLWNVRSLVSLLTYEFVLVETSPEKVAPLPCCL